MLMGAPLVWQVMSSPGTLPETVIMGLGGQAP
jgi:hypothetical protein